ncbi:hypothetical protein As57867_016592, partial [Aphanomyces stellatus]
MYQMYCGEELVATNINQDIVDEKIELAATWKQDKLKIRIRNKISNVLVRELLEMILVVDPDDRASMKAVLDHAYFKVDSSGAIKKTDLHDLGNKMESNFEQFHQKLDIAIDLSKEGLKQLACAKQDIMRGIFEATDITIPTSFVILSEDLTEDLSKKGENRLDILLTLMCNKTVEVGKSLVG